MKRLEFMAALAGMAAAPAVSAKRVKFEHAYEVAAPREKVFPLLCPVREYEWLDGWSCVMIHSESGVAEENCIFTTQSPVGPMTWCVDRYEPPALIRFVTFVPERVVMRLTIALEAAGGGRTRLTWRRMFTALGEGGEQAVHHWSLERERVLQRKLEYFLETGRMLRGVESRHSEREPAGDKQ